MCVGCVCVWVGGCVRACARACVCLRTCVFEIELGPRVGAAAGAHVCVDSYK